jgi:hypothetical protein
MKTIDFCVKYLSLILLFVFYSSFQKQDEKIYYNEEIAGNLFVISNNVISLEIDLRGGMYTKFERFDCPVNPFGWQIPVSEMPRNNQPFNFKGHFLCTGRWGKPSEGELKAGIPFNGEVNSELWKVEDTIRLKDGTFKCMMSCQAPIEKLNVERQIILKPGCDYVEVSEMFINELPIGRQTNFVQHPTIYKPFLTRNTIINSNAWWGFDQRTGPESLEDSSYIWPNALLANGEYVNLEHVKSGESFVSSHIFKTHDTVGWVTVLNPDKNILMGYIWKIKDYPWLNVWQKNIGGKPFVVGIEFGTTGLGESYAQLMRNNVWFYGHNSYDYIDAGAKIEKSYICFKKIVPDTMHQVTSVKFIDGTVHIE